MLELLLTIALSAGISHAGSVGTNDINGQTTTSSSPAADPAGPVFELGSDPPIIITGG